MSGRGLLARQPTGYGAIFENTYSNQSRAFTACAAFTRFSTQEHSTLARTIATNTQCLYAQLAEPGDWRRVAWEEWSHEASRASKRRSGVLAFLVGCRCVRRLGGSDCGPRKRAGADVRLQGRWDLEQSRPFGKPHRRRDRRLELPEQQQHGGLQHRLPRRRRDGLGFRYARLGRQPRLELGQVFDAAEITYTNGTSDTSTLIFGATLNLRFVPAFGAPGPDVADPLSISVPIVTTANTGTARQNADWVGPFGTPQPLTFNVLEGQAAHAELYGMLVDDPHFQPTLIVSTDPNGFIGMGYPGAPEPSTWAIMLLGVAGLGASLRARRKPVSLRTA